MIQIQGSTKAFGLGNVDMPSTSKKQHNFMAAIAHNPAFAKKVGVPQSVGKDFDEADKGKKFGYGGMARPDLQKVNKPTTLHGKMSVMKGGGMAKSDMKEDMAMDKKQDVAMIKKAFKQHDMQEHKGGKGTSLKLAGGGSASKRADGCATKGKTKGTMIAMKMGGMSC
jgi:hypothetical protein